MIPPTSPRFEVLGFCSEECTQPLVPKGGLEILGAILHSHYKGRRLKLYHFRNGKELEWILKDDNYDSEFQQMRMLHKPRQVLLPGDLLVVECEYDNTKVTGTSTSGFTTAQEMCTALVLLSKRVPYSTCSNVVDPKSLLSLIGVEAWEWDVDTGERLIAAPPKLAGKPLLYAADNLTDWTKAVRQKLQQAQLAAPNTGSCPVVFFPASVRSQQQTEEAAIIQKEQQKLLETILGGEEKLTDILTLAKGFGNVTLMGSSKQVPTRTPGPISSAVYTFEAEKYSSKNLCPSIFPLQLPSYPSRPKEASKEVFPVM